MKDASGSCIRNCLLACVLLILASSKVLAGQDTATNLALNFEVKKGGIVIVESQMLVTPGNNAEMVVSGKYGGEYRIEASPRFVMDVEGVTVTYLQAKLFEKDRDAWKLLASPELMAPLDRPAGTEVKLSPAADGTTTSFSLEVVRIEQPELWLKQSSAKHASLFAPEVMQVCVPCDGGGQMCCSNACCMSSGCGTVCDGRHP